MEAQGLRLRPSALCGWRAALGGPGVCAGTVVDDELVECLTPRVAQLARFPGLQSSVGADRHHDICEVETHLGEQPGGKHWPTGVRSASLHRRERLHYYSKGHGTDEAF